jgi:hypothetical protein
LLNALSLLLTTADFENKEKTTFVLNSNDLEMQVVSEVCSLLIKTCQSGELLQISYSLNAFYDIFSEGFYDSILKEQSVIEAMQSGVEPLSLLFKQVKKQK